MREELQKRDGKRGIFTATFARYGRAKGWHGREVVTLLFTEVKDSSGAVVTDHIWFKQVKQFLRLALREGERVKFVARVKPYQKGYKGARWSDGWGGNEAGTEKDYKLSFPSKVEIISSKGDESDMYQLPLFAKLL